MTKSEKALLESVIATHQDVNAKIAYIGAMRREYALTYREMERLVLPLACAAASFSELYVELFQIAERGI